MCLNGLFENWSHSFILLTGLFFTYSWLKHSALHKMTSTLC